MIYGYRGYYGMSEDFKFMVRAEKANKLIDIHNLKVNTFDTAEENDMFVNNINKRIDKIFSKI